MYVCMYLLHAFCENKRKMWNFFVEKGDLQQRPESADGEPDPSSPYNFYEAPFRKVLETANEELTNVARRTEPSVLRERSYNGMSHDEWMLQVNHELSSRCPVVASIFDTLLQTACLPEKKLPAASLIYGIVMFLRCHELSRVQRINTILLAQGDASTNVSTQVLNLTIK